MQCEFPVIYASGFKGIAGPTPETMAADLEPLFDMIVKEVAPPKVSTTSTLQMMAANIDYDVHLGRIAIGRVVSGSIKKGQAVSICSSLEPGVTRRAKISELFVYSNFSRVPVEEVMAGDICALTGLPDIKIGETVCSTDAPIPLPTIKVG